ncbi:MAG: zinc ribbon domain-containing protein [Candidatus Sulfotelmatobacter sp.]
MAFCNSCGATLNPGTKFCNKCGAAVAVGASSPGVTSTAPPPAPAPTGGGSALKVILIVVAVIVGIGILGIATVGIIGYRIAKSSHVSQNGDHVKVETPFGSVETSKDPDQAAKDLGVDLYPGAQVQRNGASSAAFGGIRTVTAMFETSDAPDKVCSFYKSRFPGAMVTTSDQNHCTIVSNNQKNMITINIQASGNNTKLQITNVSKKSSD